MLHHIDPGTCSFLCKASLRLRERVTRCLILLLLLAGSGLVFAQAPAADHSAPVDQTAQIQELRSMVLRLQQRVDVLEHQLDTTKADAATDGSEATPVQRRISDDPVAASSNSAGPLSSETTNTPIKPVSLPAQVSQPTAAASALPIPSVLPGGATLNYTFDGYYDYNFNQPPGRVNDLRAYDVLSNGFSINQATLMFDLDPDLSKGRRYGLRLDLQFGQATETLQGNPANETRPEIYRNIFQAYGTYILPIGHGLDIDFGKWASSLGVEGNYTKDQINYSRSFYFYYLPFYHAGVRASYHVSDKLAVNYWVVNGTNQSEPTNGYKDELFGFVLQPTKTISWTSNYYLGQEHPDTNPATNCTVPVQPGLCVTPITPAPNGKLHIFDNYATWQVTPKLALTGEGDYLIQRQWSTAGPGASSAPSHVSGGAAYAQYQATPRSALGARVEYFSDRNGLFSGRSQALKETTGTYKYTVADGLDAFFEFRRDWSNVPYFTTHDVGSPSGHQTTTTLGLVWWYGGKQGSW